MKINKQRIVRNLVAALLVLAAVMTSIGTAASTPAEHEGSSAHAGEIVSAAAVRTIDVSFYAASQGISFNEADRHMKLRTAMQPVLDLAAAHSRYAGSWIDRSDGYEMVIRFAGDVPTEVANAAVGMSVRLDPTAQFSADRNRQRQRSMIDALKTAGLTDVAAGVDVRTGRIRLSVGGGASLSEMPAIVLRSDVDLELHQTSVVQGEHTYGGDSFPRTSTGTLCTTGFTVSVNGEDGVLTAGHCANDRTYRQNDGLEYTTVWQDEHLGEWGDIQWHTTPHTEYDDYYFNDTQRRDVSEIGGAVAVDDYICFHGEASGGQTCDYVYDDDVSTSTYDRLVAMDNDNTVGGDSGGPWFWLGTAYGIHSGDLTLGGATRNIWSQARFVDDGMADVWIKTS